MKADTVDLAAVFGKPVHYLVPLYQRPYVWTREEQWEPLWQDVRDVADRQMDASADNDDIPHFLGAVVLEQALVSSGKIEARSIVDGQQRLTTLQLLISAARSIARQHGLDGPRQMFEKLLFNDAFLVKAAGDELKVLPTFRDRTPFRESIGDGVVAAAGGHRIHDAYRFFRSSIREWVEEGGEPDELAGRLEALSTAIWKRVVLVTIDLDPGDNAQVIFETLNARGTPLLAADLVKNHLFQTATLQGADIDELFNQYWQVLDTDWWREEVQQGRLRRPRIDIFLNHWLAMSVGGEVVSHQIFPEFKRYLAAGSKKASDVLAELARYARVYETFEKEQPSTELGQFLYRLNVMEVTTAYPPLLWLLGPDGLVDADERGTALRAIESWLVRRMLTRQTTKNYNVVFLSMLKSVRERAAARGSGPRGSDVVDFLAALRGESQAWPGDSSVTATLTTLPIYQVFRVSRLRMVLEAIEQSMRSGLSENVSLPTNLTIEHVLPQEWPQNWQLPEGVDPIQSRLARDQAKHRLGNLTLVTGRLNPRMSNGPWSAKQEALRQYSVMRISSDIRDADTWDERSIATRGERLIAAVLVIWPRPATALDEYSDAGSAVPKAVAAGAAGPPDPVDPTGFVAPLAAADEVGVGMEMRQVIGVAREVGFEPRPDRRSVTFITPLGRGSYLFTLTPKWDEEVGAFRLWKSPQAFAHWIPGLSVETAQAVLGASEEEGTLPREDVGALCEAIRGLVPTSWAPPSFTEYHDQLSEAGLGSLERIPTDVLRLIERRTGSDPLLALRFAAAALAEDGVALRGQRSKNTPWYFQVRHPKFPQVVAYVHTPPGELFVDYRLPQTHDTYGMAVVRNNFYGIRLAIADEASFAVGRQLLRDALGRPE